jgi:hypothetical protein
MSRGIWHGHQMLFTVPAGNPVAILVFAIRMAGLNQISIKPVGMSIFKAFVFAIPACFLYWNAL